MRQASSSGEKPKVRRKYLSPDEARRVIDAAGKVGRQGERDKLLLTLIYRHGLRWRQVADQARPRISKLAALMDDAEADVLAGRFYETEAEAQAEVKRLILDQTEEKRV
jgi:hypothetical protein